MTGELIPPSINSEPIFAMHVGNAFVKSWIEEGVLNVRYDKGAYPSTVSLLNDNFIPLLIQEVFPDHSLVMAKHGKDGVVRFALPNKNKNKEMLEGMQHLLVGLEADLRQAEYTGNIDHMRPPKKLPMPKSKAAPKDVFSRWVRAAVEESLENVPLATDKKRLAENGVMEELQDPMMNSLQSITRWFVKNVQKGRDSEAPLQDSDWGAITAAVIKSKDFRRMHVIAAVHRGLEKYGATEGEETWRVAEQVMQTLQYRVLHPQRELGVG